jgi:hypothetical protein
MRKLLIATPWITASGAASYIASKWGQLPGRMAVTFYLGWVSGWQARDTFVPVALVSMFGILTVLTILLSMPGKIRIREGALSDPEADRGRAVRILLLAHVPIRGLLVPLSFVHVVNRNL